MNAGIANTISRYMREQPVLKTWVFGSYARGEERQGSDIDLLVEFDRKNATIGLFKYASIIMDLEALLHIKVDLVENGALIPSAALTAEKDKKLIYERVGS